MKKREFLHFQRIRTLFSQLFSYLNFVHRFDISLFQLSHSRRVMKKHILLSFSILGLATIAPAQNQDPFAADQAAENNKSSAKKNKAASHSNNGPPKIISACFETFSLSLTNASGLLREGLSDALLYQRILKGLDAGTTEQEFLTVVRARLGEKSSSESITEEIYPTEYAPTSIDANQVIRVNLGA